MAWYKQPRRYCLICGTDIMRRRSVQCSRCEQKAEDVRLGRKRCLVCNRVTKQMVSDLPAHAKCAEGHPHFRACSPPEATP